MSTHLNIFEPYERKPAHYEDALTRAFLIVLRGVPLAHAAWLELVDRAHRANDGEGIPSLHELVAPDVYMQTSKVPEEATRVVSLVQTDQHIEAPKDAKSSDRAQVLDGVVSYGELAIVIENKPWHGHIWKEQLEVNIPEHTEHDPKVACVVWMDIVSAWGRLLDSGHLSVAEAVLVGDFLDYIERHFSALRPYSRVGLCGNDHARLTRRCKAALTQIAGAGRVRYHRGWGWNIDLEGGQCARKIGLHPESTSKPPLLVIDIAPADTTGQARIAYSQVPVARVEALLKQPRWAAWPNFHLMFMTSSFFRPGHRHEALEYWELWSKNLQHIRQWKRPEFSDAFAKLLELGMVRPDQRDEFDNHTKDTNRNTICFAPGVTFQWQLPLEEAAQLDDRGQLEDEIAAAIEQGCEALGLRRSWLVR